MFENNKCCNEMCNIPCEVINCAEHELCDIKVDLTKARVNLVNLVRIMCIVDGCICDEEQEILFAIEASLKEIDCKLDELSNNFC